jgi:type VI secretion system protein ImpI
MKEDVIEMELSLEIVSYHRLSPEQVITKGVTDTLTLGRSDVCDWHMPDPEKVVSGTHARITKRSDDFFIEDLSTNGLYVNRAVEALGTNREHKIEHDDLFTFGDYEISAKLQMLNVASNSSPLQDVQNVATLPQDKVIPASSSSMLDTGFESDLAGFDSAMLLNQSRQQSAGLSQMNSDLQDHFQPPVAIPEEWDKDIFGQDSQAHTNADIRSAVPQEPAPLVAQAPVNPIKVTQTVKTEGKKVAPVAPKSKVSVSSQVSPASALSKAFFQGLGVNEQDYVNVLTEELMFELGQSMQFMLTGLMESLRQRSKLKTEFRINQTTFQQRENNPLKFSANIDDVFQNLFLRKSASFLSSQQAITEAFNDGRKHDTALTAGTLGAIRGLLNQLDPEFIEAKSQNQSLTDMLVPGQKQMRQWKVYKSLHSNLKTEFMQDSAAALSDDFVKAYDNKIKTL